MIKNVQIYPFFSFLYGKIIFFESDSEQNGNQLTIFHSGFFYSTCEMMLLFSNVAAGSKMTVSSENFSQFTQG